jgi:MFS superfamily sulfate permease-like transporter
MPLMGRFSPVGRMWPASLDDAGHDLAAALALTAVAIPEQLATARLAGVPAATGLLVFAAASLGFFLLGSNRSLSLGADSTIAPIFAGSLALLAASGSPHYLALCAGLALLVGAMVGAAGMLRLGWIANLLSEPVIVGFLAGIAVHIARAQLPVFFSGGQPNFFAIAIGLTVFAVTFLGEKIDRRIPAALIATLLTAFSVWLFDLTARGVAVLQSSTGGVRIFAPSDLNWNDTVHLLPIALIISLVVMIQTAATSRSFPGDPDEIDINQDFIGAGLGGILSGLIGGFAVSASPPRTGLVQESGGRSQLTGLCAAILVALFFALGLSLLRFLPVAALAGLLLFVAARICRVGVMVTVARQSLPEFGLLAATAVAIVFLPIATGVAIGITLSLLHGVWTIAQTRAILFEKIPGSTVWWPAGGAITGERVPGVVVVGFQAPLFFLNAQAFRRSLDRAVLHAPAPVKAIVLEASSIVELDFSGARMLEAEISYWKTRKVDFYIARLESVRAQRALERFGIVALLGEQCIFHSVDEVIRRIS